MIKCNLSQVWKTGLTFKTQSMESITPTEKINFFKNYIFKLPWWLSGKESAC